jgi:hypothetical protein
MSVLFAAITVDGNGRIFGLEERASTISAVVLGILCFATSAIVAITDRSWRLLAIITIVLLLLFLPAI